MNHGQLAPHNYLARPRPNPHTTLNPALKMVLPPDGAKSAACTAWNPTL
jgi:hypothetical protein